MDRKTIVVATNSFKGSLSSVLATNIIGDALSEAGFNVVKQPLADGGEGSCEIVSDALKMERFSTIVTSPDNRRISADAYLRRDFGLAEVAKASGICMEARLDALGATSYGFGELITALLDRGAKKIALFLGGSATTDGGAGMAAALGAKFYSKSGEAFAPVGGTLIDIEKIDFSDVDKRIFGVEFTAYTDVNNVLLGDNGAARVFAPQKGANAREVVLLEDGMAHFADIMTKAVGEDFSKDSGAGAAGGIGFMCAALLKAKLVSGSDYIFEVTDFVKKSRFAYAFVTGEGRLDNQSFMGKTLGKIVKVAAKRQVFSVCGSCENIDFGRVTPVVMCKNEEKDDCMKNAKKYLVDAAKQIAEKLKKEVVYKNGEVLIGDKFLKRDFAVRDGVFTAIEENIACEEFVDFSAKRILPGLIDVHTHGAAGFDFNSAKSFDDLDKITDFYAAHGVTSVFATVMTDSDEHINRSLKLIADYAPTSPILRCVHLEGPFLSNEFRGAQPLKYIAQPSISKFEEFQESAKGLIKYVTLAPEQAGAAELVKYLTSHGVVVSLGHSGASYDEATLCLNLGARCFTHTLNGMAQLDKLKPNIATAALLSDSFCEVITDGKHLSPLTVKLLLKTKGINKIVAITDSLAAAGVPDGIYSQNGVSVSVKDGDVIILGTNTRAGSTLNAFLGLLNFAHFCDIPLEQAAATLTKNPAALLDISDRGAIEIGKKADFIVLSGEKLLATYSEGDKL